MKLELTSFQLQILQQLMERDDTRNYRILDGSPADGYTATIERHIFQVALLRNAINQQLMNQVPVYDITLPAFLRPQI